MMNTPKKERKKQTNSERQRYIYITTHNNIHEGTGIFLQGT
jgi:hypothetical protein